LPSSLFWYLSSLSLLFVFLILLCFIHKYYFHLPFLLIFLSSLQNGT
jgi:hypothetical protein